MNEDAVKALRGFAYFVILTLFCCAYRCLLALCDDDNENPTDDPRPSFHENKAAGIHSSVLRSIPVVSFNSRDFKESVECVVCLSELVDGDKAKVLPSCNHCFHAECIDTWLQSDSTTCPICRNNVEEIQTHDPVVNELPLSTVADSAEVYEDMTAVVIDIPAEPEIGESGLIKASDLYTAHTR